MWADILNIAIVLPRNMHFGPARATAIDLSARDYARFSRFSPTITLVAERVENPFAEACVQWFAPRTGVDGAISALKAVRPDLILVEQHRPSANAIRRAFPHTPVVLHRHGAQKPPGNALAAWLLRRAYRRFAGILVKSTPMAEELDAILPGLDVPVQVAGNGLDISQWHPAVLREEMVLFVGRLAPEKGVLEAARAATRALVGRKDWRVRFLCAEAGHDDYAAKVRSALEPLGSRATVETDVAHDAVRTAFERAAIALVPSFIRESFGRTALEAMAGGSALVTSGSGGLAEVAGRPEEGAAITLPEISAEAIAAAITGLIESPGTRARIAAAGRARAEALFDIRRQAALLDDALVEFSNNFKLRRCP